MINSFETLYRKFKERVRVGIIFYYDSTREAIREGKYEFDLAHCPALVKRVSDEKVQKETKAVKINPFFPPDPATLIKSIELENGSLYNLLFNKYCVTPLHLLITTSEYISQDSPLSWDDFRVAMKVTCEFMLEDADWMVFYNCGAISGASQQHKHIQLVMIGKDTKVPLSISDMEEIYGPRYFCPFLNNPRDDELLKCWHDSYTKLMSFVEAGCSTNILFTKKWMLVVPRKKLGFNDWNPNSLIFVGYLLSRSDEETKMIKELGPLNIIKSLGCINEQK
jgi:ATP adenylyltransferase